MKIPKATIFITSLWKHTTSLTYLSLSLSLQLEYSYLTSFSECIFRVYLIQGYNQKISLYLVWKNIICSTKSLLNHPFIYFLKGEIHVLNLNRISVIRIDSLLIFYISKLICRDQSKIYNFHLLTSSRLSAVRDKNNNECFIFCNPGLQKE